MLTKLGFLCILGFYFNPVSAQKIEDFINSYIGDNAKDYLRPLSDMITGNIHTGIREWSLVDSNFRIKLGLVVMASAPTSGMRHFTAKTSFGFEPEQSAKVPTIIGPNEAVALDGDNGTVFIFPVGYNLTFLPMAAPQLTIGGLFHSELTVRYFGFDLKDEVGKIAFLGLGARHQLNPYLKNFPFDLSVGYFYHRFSTEPYLFSNHHLFSGHIGKSSRIWSGMLTLGFQASATRFQYEYGTAPNNELYEVRVRGAKPLFAELSGALKLWIFQFRASVGYAGPWNAAFGMNIRI